ncbi:hypothetical protein CXF70_00040 [Planomicrobium sp. MB-3u-38]|nr:hypothetical protein CXF70_00040 [Planomicrobium sp. MB-3u-38]
MAVGVWTLEKRRHPLSSERHKTEQRSDPDRAAGPAYDPKSWVAGVWIQKSGNGRSALKTALPYIQLNKQVKK